MEESKTLFKKSIESQLLYERLIKVPLDDPFISYEDLSKIIGYPIQTNRGPLYTALKTIQREHAHAFATITGKGIKRLTDEEAARSGIVSIDRIKREAKRGLNRVVCVDNYETLSQDAKIKHNTAATIFGMLIGITKKSKLKTLETKVAGAQQQLPLIKTLEAFGMDIVPNETA